MKASLFLSILFGGVLAANVASATTHTIQVGPNNTTTFSPDSITVALGDTIRWVYGGSDTHTTTSQAGIPATAAPWDAPIDVSNTSFTYVPTVIGIYNYECTPHVSMGMTGKFVVTGPTSLTNTIVATDIKLSPNPASNDVRIRLAAGASVDLLDVSGKFIRHMQPASVSTTEQQFKVDDLAAGMYFLNIKTAGVTVTKKLQIAR